MTPSARKEAIRRAEDAALKAASESRWDDAYSFLEIRRGLLKMDQDHLSAADSSAASGSVIPARPTLPAEGERDVLPLSLGESISAAQVCCGQYDKCHRACTPRGRWEGQRSSIREDGQLKVAVDLLREVVGPLEVSAACADEGAEELEALLANVKQCVDQFDRALTTQEPQ